MQVYHQITRVRLKLSAQTSVKQLDSIIARWEGYRKASRILLLTLHECWTHLHECTLQASSCFKDSTLNWPCICGFFLQGLFFLHAKGLQKSQRPKCMLTPNHQTSIIQPNCVILLNNATAARIVLQCVQRLRLLRRHWFGFLRCTNTLALFDFDWLPSTYQVSSATDNSDWCYLLCHIKLLLDKSTNEVWWRAKR